MSKIKLHDDILPFVELIDTYYRAIRESSTRKFIEYNLESLSIWLESKYELVEDENQFDYESAREKRKNSGLTQVGLVQLLGFNDNTSSYQGFLSKIENGLEVPICEGSESEFVQGFSQAYLAWLSDQ